LRCPKESYQSRFHFPTQPLPYFYPNFQEKPEYREPALRETRAGELALSAYRQLQKKTGFDAKTHRAGG